jgi:hypothetical protein
MSIVDLNIFDLRHDMDRDEWELGLRVACSLFIENVSPSKNFISILKLKHRGSG